MRATSSAGRFGFRLSLAVLVVLLGFGTGSVAAADRDAFDDPNCYAGCPLDATAKLRVISRPSHTLANNPETKFADWVAYRVSAERSGGGAKRVWKADPLLPAEETLEPEDYRGAHAKLATDRGHQAPLASLTGLPGWEEANYLSNITPQKSDLNQGPWRLLEEAERRAALAGDARIYVLTGPLYERDMPALPEADEPHRVPSGYWKLVVMQSGETAAWVAFAFDQDTPRGADYCAADFRLDLADLERRSGLDFFARSEAVPVAPAPWVAVRLGCPEG